MKRTTSTRSTKTRTKKKSSMRLLVQVILQSIGPDPVLNNGRILGKDRSGKVLTEKQSFSVTLASLKGRTYGSRPTPTLMVI